MSDVLRTYIVSAYHLTERMVRIVATSEEEAVRLVKDGQGYCYDSEPMRDVFRPKWKAKEAPSHD